MNPRRQNKSHPNTIGKPVLGAVAFRRRVDNELAGETPALPGMPPRFGNASRSLRKVVLLTGLLVIGLANGFFAAAQPTNTTAGTDYSSFRIIADRNIFDPNRFPHTTRSVRRTTNNRVPAFSLAGTMSYKKGMLAFFDGTETDYRKVLTQNGAIAGYKVVEITLRGVKLESAGKAVEMKVGAQMRQEGGGGWQLAGPGEPPVSTTETSAPATGSPPPSADPSLEGNDVLKKLMQQREQELK